MIQRVQSLFFLFSSICLIIIIYYFPVIQDLNTGTNYFLKEHFEVTRVVILISATLSLFAISQFNNRKRQRLIGFIARFMITVSLVLLVFFDKNDKELGIGTILLIIPFTSLIIANYFIKKDDKLIRSADRLR